MSEQPTYPLELLRAELQAAMAKQMVELMDRFASKRDLADLRAEVGAHEKSNQAQFAAIDTKLDTLLTEKDQRDGADGERSGKQRRRDVVWNWAIALLGSLIGAGATLAGIALSH